MSRDFINTISFISPSVTTAGFNEILRQGFRRYGEIFYRSSYEQNNGETAGFKILPIRINLSKFKCSKSQRRCLNANSDLSVKVSNIETLKEGWGEKRFLMSWGYASKFKDNWPDIESYIFSESGSTPVICLELSCYLGEELIAASYLDYAGEGTSAVVAMYDVSLSFRRLGIFTILKEIEYSISMGCSYYYLGYIHQQNSMYDYKKQFYGLEYYNIDLNIWEEYPRR